MHAIQRVANTGAAGCLLSSSGVDEDLQPVGSNQLLLALKPALEQGKMAS